MSAYPHPSSEVVSRRMRRIRATHTKPELVVRRLVHGMGYRYRLHRRDLPGRPDLVFASRRKVIFVHGCFWHRHDCRAGHVDPRVNQSYWRPKLERNQRRDADNLSRLRAEGWHAMVIWECETADRHTLAGRISAFLDDGQC